MKCSKLVERVVVVGGGFSDGPGETGLQRTEAVCVNVCVRRPCAAPVTCHAWHGSGRAAGGRGKHHLPGTVGVGGCWVSRTTAFFFPQALSEEATETRSDGSATDNQTAGMLCLSSTQPRKEIRINARMQPNNFRKPSELTPVE